MEGEQPAKAPDFKLEGKMPILYFLKNPPLTLASRGSLDKATIKKLLKSTPMISAQAPDGGPLLIAVRQDVNIAYIKEITDDSLKKMREEVKEMQKGGRIETPSPGFMFPGKKGRKPS